MMQMFLQVKLKLHIVWPNGAELSEVLTAALVSLLDIIKKI